VVPEFKRKVEEYKLMLPVISNLRNKALKDRHWERIEAEVGQQIDIEGDLTLGTLLDMHVTAHKDVIATVSTEATQVSFVLDLLA
jgi:dynein heavy chain